MKQTKPNILLIVADQLIASMIGAYGNSIAKTPNMDRLAQRSVVFDAAYSSCPICAPARMSLMTGQYVSDINCNDNTSILATEEPTMCHYLNSAGYDTVLSGKMHFIGPDQLHGYAKRFVTDVYPSDFNWLVPKEKTKGFSSMHKNPIAIDYVAKGCGVRQWSMQLDYDEETHFRAQEYLRYKRSRPSGTLQKDQPVRDDTPFFLTVSYQHPHEPFHCMQKYWDLYEGVDIPIPEYPEDLEKHLTEMDRQLNTFHGCGEVDLKNPESLKVLHRSYLASVSYVDDKVGELLQALDDYGLTDDTIIMLTSDHGDMLGERGMVQKRCFYEQSARIPLMAHFPKNFALGKNGTKCSDPVSITDIMPTILDMAGVKDHLPVAGSSILPQCAGETDPDRFVFSENHSEGVAMPCFMVRKGAYKYVYIHGHETQLFDLKNDPHEWENLSGNTDHAQIEQELRTLILDRFDPEKISRELAEYTRKRWVVKESMLATGGPNWDFQPIFDASQQYWRKG